MSAADAPVPAAGLTAFSNTVVVSYESHDAHCNAPLVDRLVSYLWNFKTQTMHTYLCVKDVRSVDPKTKVLRNYAPIINTINYKKTHVSSTRELRGVQSDLMILLGHGHKHTDLWPASIQFYDATSYGGEHYDDLILWADSQKMRYANGTPLKLVTGQAAMLMLFCCYGNDIVPMYLEDIGRSAAKPDEQDDLAVRSPKKRKTEHTPQTQDVLYFDCDQPLMLCVDVFMWLLVSMAEVPWDVPNIPVSERFTPITVRIMQIVRLFDEDSHGFWSFLETVGCVVLLEKEKLNQQQQTLWPKNQFFRVGGTGIASLDSFVKPDLLAGLRALTLVTWTAAAGVRDELTRSVTGTNPPDIVFDAPAKDGSNKHVDEFLRTYHAKKHRQPRNCVVSAAAPAASLRALLAQLRAIDVEDTASR